MKPAICSQCGAQIEINERGTGVCKFCNTSFIMENSEHLICFNSGLEHLKLGNFHEASKKFRQAFDIFPKSEYKLYEDIAVSKGFADIDKILNRNIAYDFGKGSQYVYDGSESACFGFVVDNANKLQKERWKIEFGLDFSNYTTALISLIEKILFNKSLLNNENYKALSLVYKKLAGEPAKKAAQVFAKYALHLPPDSDFKHVSTLFLYVKPYLSESENQELSNILKQGKNAILDGVWSIDFPSALTVENGTWIIPNGVKRIIPNLDPEDNSFVEFLKGLKKVIIPPTLENSFNVDVVEFSEGCTQESILKIIPTAKKAVILPDSITVLAGQVNRKLLYNTNLFIISKKPFSNNVTYAKAPYFASNGILTGFFTCIMGNHLFYENSYLERLTNIKNFYKDVFGTELPADIIIHPIADYTKIGNEPAIIERYNKKLKKKSKGGLLAKLFGKK